MAEAIYVSDFAAWVTDRLNEYTRAGFNDPDAPNYDPSQVPAQLAADFNEAYPKGLRVVEDQKEVNHVD